MCNCIEDIEIRLMIDYCADFACFEHFGNQGSEISYARYKKGSSSILGNRKYLTIPWKFCPFCGVEINQESPQPQLKE